MEIRLFVKSSNRWACGAGYNSKRTGQACYQDSGARKLSRSQSDTLLMAPVSRFFILCSQDCGLAAPSVSGSANSVRITRKLMCFSTLYRGYILLPLIERQQGPDTNILHAIHWVA